MVRKKVGIALSGGGAKGLAHIGVLKVLEENNIKIDLISGTSAGAVVGAYYPKEANIKIVEKEILKIDWENIFDYTFPTRGIIKGKRIEKILRKKFEDLKFSDLKIPLHLTRYTQRYNEAEKALKDNPQITKLIGHSLGGSVSLELEKNNKNKTFEVRTYGAPVW